MSYPDDLWTDKQTAKRLLSVAVDRYVDAQLGRPGRAEPIRDFALDRNQDAVEQLRSTYARLVAQSSAAAHFMVSASHELYELKRRALPPRYFEAVILGSFLLIAAPEEMKPDPEYFLRFFRPLIDSKIAVERGVYFSSLANLYDRFASAAEPRPKKLKELLWSEWDFLAGEKRFPAAALSRVLIASEPESWPILVSTIADILWPSEQEEAAQPEVFKRSIQNMLSEVKADVFAENYWRLAEYFCGNPRRGEVTASAIFSDDSKREPSNDLAPFRLIPPDREGYFWNYRVASRKSPQMGRSFPLNRGAFNPDAFGAYTLSQVLVSIYTAASVSMMNAA